MTSLSYIVHLFHSSSAAQFSCYISWGYQHTNIIEMYLCLCVYVCSIWYDFDRSSMKLHCEI